MNNKVVIGIGAMIVVLFISFLVVQTFQINSIKKEIPGITGYATKQISTRGWTENEIMNYDMHGTIPAKYQTQNTNPSIGSGMVGGC